MYGNTNFQFDLIMSWIPVTDIFTVIIEERQGSLSLTILIMWLKFICFSNLVL